MADITMCKGTDCVIKHRCYRFTAPQCEYRQSFFVDVPLRIIDKDNQECDHFYDNSGYPLTVKVEYNDEGNHRQPV